MTLVALQVGMQPAIMRACVPQAVSGRSLVLMEMAISIALALLVMPQEALEGWSFLESFRCAGPPAIVYALRSLLKQAAYRLCDSVSFNVFNQTKVVFCAMAAWFLTGEAQAPLQCLALLCAVAAGALLAVPTRAQSTTRRCQGRIQGRCQRRSRWQDPRKKACIVWPPLEEGSKAISWHATAFLANSNSMSCIAVQEEEECNGRLDGGGKENEVEPHRGVSSQVPLGARDVLPCCSGAGAALAIATSACSGVAAALSQAAMRYSFRHSSLFALELALWGVPFVLLFSGGDEKLFNGLRGWKECFGWKKYTILPVLLQAMGGLLVSAVVKQQGSVAMGLCTVAGIGVSVVVDAVVTRRLPSRQQVCAATLCGLSVVVHQASTWRSWSWSSVGTAISR